MYVVIHEGTAPAAEGGTLARQLGPDGELARERRLEPGYLGSLLLVGRPVVDGDAAFLLLEMWDDRVGPVSGSRLPGVAPPIAWTRGPRVFFAMR
jgi:hypothetical protein